MPAIKSIFRGSHKDRDTAKRHSRRLSTPTTPKPVDFISHTDLLQDASLPAIDITDTADDANQDQAQAEDATPRLRTKRSLDSSHLPDDTDYTPPTTTSGSAGRRNSAMGRPSSGHSQWPTEPTSGKTSRRGSKNNRSEDGHGKPEVLNRHELMRRAMAAAKDPLLDDDLSDDEAPTPIGTSAPGFGSDANGATTESSAPPRYAAGITPSSSDGHGQPRDFPSMPFTSTPSKSSTLPAIITPSPIRAEIPRSDSLDEALSPNAASFQSQRRASEMARQDIDDDFEGTPPVRSKTFHEVVNNHLAAGPHMSKSASTTNVDVGGKLDAKAPSSPLLKPGPLSRLRKNSNDGSSGRTKKSSTGPSGGIAGALAASSMTGVGIGQAAASQQHASALMTGPPARSTAVSAAGAPQPVRPFPANQDAGYQGGIYRNPATGEVVESPSDEFGQYRSPMRPGRDRSVSSLVSYDGSVTSERSSASGLGAAAGFGAAAAARLAPIGATLPPPPGQNAHAVHDGYSDVMSASGSGPSIEAADVWADEMGPQITGFAVASSKRNKDFHQLFPQVPEDDYLIEDYGCALSREILIHGRIYISENFICFNANIFGWVTNLVVPFSDIVAIEKRMTAFVIPNAIQLATINSKHSFVSFLSRDTTYDLIVNIWRLSHPGLPPTAAEQASELTDEYSEDDDGDAATAVDKGESVDGHTKAPKPSKRARLKRRFKGNKNGIRDETLAAAAASAARTGSPLIAPSRSPAPGAKRAPHRKTTCPCDEKKEHFATVALDTTYPAVPEKIYNLLFTSGFTKDFWTDNQKLFELEIGEWSPSASNNNMLSRNVSYIKPLTGSFGPKQTKCLLTDENMHVDFDNYVTTLTTTRTPDVPSGGSFSVKTRTCITWAGGGNVSRVYVTCAVEWTGRSMIKGIIEKACIDGQKQYYTELDEEVRTYLTEHTSEFKEEGDDAKAVEEIARAATPAVGGGGARTKTPMGSSRNDGKASSGGGGGGGSSALGAKTGGDGDDGGLLGTVMATASDAASMAFDLVSGAVESVSSLVGGGEGGASTKMVALSAIVVLLVLSNLWTWRSSPSSSSAGRMVGPGGNMGYMLPDGYYAPPSPRYYVPPPPPPASQGEEVARAVREVLLDFLGPNGGGGGGFKQPTRQPPVGAGAVDEEAIRRLLDEAEEKVRRLKEEVEALGSLKKKLERDDGKGDDQQQQQQQRQGDAASSISDEAGAAAAGAKAKGVLGWGRKASSKTEL